MKPRLSPSRAALIERYGERYKWIALSVVALGTIAAVLSTTSFNVAIPALMAHFGLGQERVQWAITGFMGAMTLAMLPTPWLLDRFGFRTCFLSAILVLALASVAGSLSPSFGFLVAMRVIQGAAAGLLQPLGALAVLRLFPPQAQGRAGGVLGFGIVLAPAVAPALGGILLDLFGWPAIFWLNLPFCLVAGVAALFLLPVAGERSARPFDWTGVSLLALATVGAIESVAGLHHSGLFSLWTLVPAAAALLGFGGFVVHSRRAAAPIIHPGLFADRAFAMGNVVSFAYGFGLYASTYLIPVFMLSALGYSATEAGATLLPAGIALALCMPLAGRLADRYPPRRVAQCGLAVFGASFALLAVYGGDVTHGELIAFTILGRIGLGLILPSLNLAALRGLAPHQLGQSSTVITYARQLGGVLGVAICAVFVEWRMAAMPADEAGAFAQGFVLVAVVFGIAFLAALRMRRADGA
ncbi:multidrug efflux MFS transporter [Pseudothauera nasutitermitis]|uniref:Multidrug efflux MFS transporter n=1 Tax=Pseudothauera nasutitermitis TaxID=2565930 RepID=A0A4S4AT91_9RHOO|nr:DHA2 family efflux MFS transporter permease subunit [Pseudothauera nasutitermitis]THF62990.1 multidrug efflux MFS transporter [Pseudothauera nasutitermitis]